MPRRLGRRVSEEPDPADLNDAENWHGGFYELAIELGPREDERLESTLRSVWDLIGVEDCHVRTQLDPPQHEPAEVSLAALEANHLHGVVRLPSGRRVVCGAIAVREDDGPDWLDFVLPLGSLSRAEP